MMTTSAPGGRTALWLALLGLVACGGDTGPAPVTEDVFEVASGPVCEWDDSTDAATAVALFAGGEAAGGYLCPEDDADWYAFTTAPGEELVTVSLAMDGDLSPVQPTYAIWSRDEEGAAVDAVEGPPVALVGQALEVVHCLEPGDWLLAVRDHNDDGEDVYRPYVLSLETASEPDANEPNGDAVAATVAASGVPLYGAVSCRGDEDWYAADVPEGHFLRLRLEAPAAGWQPVLNLLTADGQVVATETNPGLGATSIDRYAVLPGAGVYYAVVSDNDGLDADPTGTYTLTIDVLEDLDPWEPNEGPTEATDLAGTPTPCGPEWSDWFEVQGTVGSQGDNDWYRLPVQGCANGLVEAELSFPLDHLSAADAWAAQAAVQASLSLVREDDATPCGADGDCLTLNRPCSSTWDCAGYFNVCLPDGVCAGSGACLPSGQCGAIVLEKHYQSQPVPLDPSQGPPPNVAVISAPLFGDDAVWLEVADYQSNGAAPDVVYTMRVRVRADPDPHEPDNVYSPDLPKGFPVGVQQPHATTVEVLECVLPKEPSPVSKGNCCKDDTWIEGAISYENDQDWYRYAHPCPGEDCMVRILFELDEGPVDHLFNIYKGGSLWFDTLTQLEEKESQAPVDSHFGGLQPEDACFYAYQAHVGNPFYYYLTVRDLAASHDWAPGQGYRFCVEKVSNDCEDPCRRYTDGCGPK